MAAHDSSESDPLITTHTSMASLALSVAEAALSLALPHCLGPWPSLPPPLTQQSAFMWPFLWQLWHSTLHLSLSFLLLESTAKASSFESLPSLPPFTSCFSQIRRHSYLSKRNALNESAVILVFVRCDVLLNMEIDPS